MTHSDLVSGRAVSPDFTGHGWRDRLGFHETPLLSLHEAGVRLAHRAQRYDFTFFEHWPSDLVGHRQAFQQAVEMLERFDSVIAGVLTAWDWSQGMVLITSDHGNIEDLAVRTHTRNPVPTILIGQEHARLAVKVRDLTDVAPIVRDFITG